MRSDIHLPGKCYDKIEQSVLSLYIENNINSLPINPKEIALDSGYILNTFSSLPPQAAYMLREKGEDGINYFDSISSRFIICYDEQHSLQRIRFTIMHEIGHIKLGHKEDSELAEIMANYFASYSLAPSPLIYKCGCETFVDIMDQFDLSESCALICFNRYVNWQRYAGLSQLDKEFLNLIRIK